MCIHKDEYFHVHLRFCIIMLKQPRDASLETTLMSLAFSCSQAVEENGY